MDIVWAEIDLNAIGHNVQALRRITSPHALLMAVVKANAYGHGAIEVAQQALISGAERLGVARLDEGIRLREAGIESPILIFGYTPPELGDQLMTFQLTQTVYTVESAKALSEIAVSRGGMITVHIKVDTGMGRLGMLAGCLQPSAIGTRDIKEAADEILSILRLPGLEVEGVFTHFASADSADKSYTKQQFDVFKDLLGRLRHSGFEPAMRHAANSAALIDFPEAHLDMVRPGISIYGLYPSAEVKMDRVDLKPAMSLRARIVHLKEVPAGFRISYGMTYITKKPTTVATVPIGYADGLNRLLSSRGQMLVRGKRAPIVGRVCMDLSMLDVGHIPGVQVKDEVVILGRQGEESITADEIALQLNTINYEVVSSVMERVPRIYIRG